MAQFLIAFVVDIMPPSRVTHKIRIFRTSTIFDLNWKGTSNIHIKNIIKNIM